jgi:hypothetical protein
MTFGSLKPNRRANRNRHTVENDCQSALVKRINRQYARKNCDRKVRIIGGQPTLLIDSTGVIRPFPADTLQGLAWILGIV